MNPADIFKKLKLNSSQKLLIIKAPREYEEVLSGIPYDTAYTPDNKGTYDFIQVFAHLWTELEESLSKLSEAGKYDCLFWICYPKGSGPVKSDLKRDTIWEAFKIVKLRQVTQIAIDETWSALRGRPDELVGK